MLGQCNCASCKLGINSSNNDKHILHDHTSSKKMWITTYFPIIDNNLKIFRGRMSSTRSITTNISNTNHERDSMCLSCCKPSVKEKDEMKHWHSLFSNSKKKNNVIIDNVNNNQPNSHNSNLH